MGREGGLSGGKIMAIRQRTESIKKYYENPNYCLLCNSVIEVDNKKVSEIKNKKFCDQSCAAKWNNIPRKKIKLPKIKESIINNKTKEEFFKEKGYFRARSSICKQAKDIFKKSQQYRKCVVCEYDRHIEICHIKAVADFPNNALISEINNINNLIALCPNHHWEFDNSYLDISQAGRCSTEAHILGLTGSIPVPAMI